MNYLITGATGFIGSHLVNFLTKKNNNIFCVIRNYNNSKINNYESLHIINGDLRDISTINKLPKAVDVIIHSAAMLGGWNIDKKKIFDANVQITQLLLEWFSFSECRQFIFLSTPGVQGLGYKIAKESFPYNSRDLYEKTKVIAEKNIQNYQYKNGKAWTIVRPDFVYGPGDIRRIKLYKRIKNRLWINIGKGTSVLRPTYVLDLCKAIMMLSLNPQAYFQIFNVAGPELITSDQYILTIAKVLGVKLLPIRLNTTLLMWVANFFEYFAKFSTTTPIVTKSQIDFLTKDHGTDISKIKEKIGFTPEYNLENGMRKTLNWAKNNGLL